MFVLMTPAKVKAALAANMRERRLAVNLTQAGLSERSGVTLGTLRRFEQSGEISIDNLGAYIPECPYLGNFFQSGG